MATPAHRKSTETDDATPSPWRRPTRIGLLAGAVLAAGALTAGIVVAAGASSGPAGRPTATRGGSGGASGGVAATTTTTAPIIPLTVRSISPAPHATGVATDSHITVTFSVAPRADSPAPTLTPAIPGHWTRDGTRWVFRPLGGYIPSTAVSVTIPASTAAVEGARAVHLSASYHDTFTVGTGSVLRLQQLLAELKYLPLSFTRTAGSATGAGAQTTSAVLGGLAEEPAVAADVRTSPVPGRFTWSYPNIPSSLAALWQPGQANKITTGAVMAFEADHGLAVDGIAGPEVWATLVKAVAARQVDARPYDYIEVTEADPETLSVWQDGTVVYTSPANTGAAGAATELGIFPVYLRYATHSMVGTNPDGTKYDDPAIPWIAYFNGGDAIHGYPRASYGYPQSNGCVELPIANAGVVWNANEDWYGTLVDVY